ncbi:hypothetical protein LUZ60_015208 [Juncus effusus]|nr:hypothetical protein LUZ60_015208 [Juncus effusus]
MTQELEPSSNQRLADAEPKPEGESDRIPINQDLLQALYKGQVKPIRDLLGSKNRNDDEISIPVGSIDSRSKENDGLFGFTFGGNSALHFIASQGDVSSAETVYRRNPSLLQTSNEMGETPLHWAARCGRTKMVSELVSFARDEGKEAVETLLRKRNRYGETALHEAAQYKQHMVVKVLMAEDRFLAEMVDTAGMSPLYVATVVGAIETVRALIEPFPDGPPSKWCYVGKENRTALHAAVFVNQDITNQLLKWKVGLTKEVDDRGNTPLHYAASVVVSTTIMLLDTDASQAYKRDTNGSYPVHVAAKMGHVSIIKAIFNKCPDSDELLDRAGRNYLHVAVNYGRWKIVRFICNSSVRASKTVNARDNEGNTPLHLAAKNKDHRIVALLLCTKGLCQDIMNNEGKTPCDVANMHSDFGIRYGLNPEAMVDWCFTLSKASQNPCLLDHSMNRSDNQNEFERGLNKYKSLTKSLSIGSVLIATVTFAATFTMPGGYKSDDDMTKAGSAILANKYTFRTFLISDTVAFFCSLLATFFLTASGTSNVDISHRKRYLHLSLFLLLFAAEGMVIAFASGVYVVIFPGISRVGFLVCLMTLVALLLVVDSSTWYAFYCMAIVQMNQLKWSKFVQPESYVDLSKTIISMVTRDHTIPLLFGMAVTCAFIFLIARI